MDEDQFFKERADSNIFKQILYKYLPFWPLFVLTTGISMIVAYIDLRAQVPEFVAQAKVLLKDPQKSGGDTKVLDALNIFSEKKIVDNEIVILRSTDIMQEVVKDLGLYAIVYNKGNVRTEQLYKSSSPLQFIAVDRDSFNLWGTYYFTMDWSHRQLDIDHQKVGFDDTLVLNGNKMWLNINQEYNQSAQGKNFFVNFAPPSAVAGGLVGGLNVSSYSYQSTILNVSLSIPVQEEGRDILNKVFEIYNKDAINDKNQMAEKTLQFIDGRLEVVSEQLDSVENKIARYKAKESIVDLSSQATNYLSKVQDLDKQNSDIDLKLEALDNLVNYVNSKGNYS
jgi:tyrosine-protein kinase Etk/Wzc